MQSVDWICLPLVGLRCKVEYQIALARSAADPPINVLRRDLTLIPNKNGKEKASFSLTHLEMVLLRLALLENVKC